MTDEQQLPSAVPPDPGGDAQVSGFLRDAPVERIGERSAVAERVVGDPAHEVGQVRPRRPGDVDGAAGEPHSISAG